MSSGKDILRDIICKINEVLVQHGMLCLGRGEIDGENDGYTTESSKDLPDGWDQNLELVVLRYVHSETSQRFLIKCLKMGNHYKVHTMEVLKNGDVSEATVFNSDCGSAGMEKALKEAIIDKIDKQMKTNKQPSTTSNNNNNFVNDPLRVPPLRRPNPYPYPGPIPQLTGGYGASDLNPTFGPPSFPQFPSAGGGGMYFQPPSSQPFGPQPNPLGLPPGAVPPRARFDPYGPINPDSIDPRTQDPRNARAEPDPDHMAPPGYRNMFM